MDSDVFPNIDPGVTPGCQSVLDRDLADLSTADVARARTQFKQAAYVGTLHNLGNGDRAQSCVFIRSRSVMQPALISRAQVGIGHARLARQSLTRSLHSKGRLRRHSGERCLAHQGVDKIAYQRRTVDPDIEIDTTSSVVERDQQRRRHSYWLASTFISVWFRSRR